MLKFEDEVDEDVAPTPVDDEDVQVDHAHSDPTEPVSVQDSPTGAAARMLERAAVTAEELVATAQAEADAIVDASRGEARQFAAELARRKDEQTAQLGRERATALTGLAEEKAALESQIATLRSLQSDHHSQMRRHLLQQLEVLESAAPDPSVPDVG